MKTHVVSKQDAKGLSSFRGPELITAEMHIPFIVRGLV